MCRRLIDLVSFVLVLSLTTSAVTADPFQQDPGPDGIVSMEAENFDENIPNPPHDWIFVTEPAGFSGDGAMQSTPVDPLGGAGNDTGYVDNSPRLDYEVNFVKAGTHYIWIRGYGQDGNSDSCHAGARAFLFMPMIYPVGRYTDSPTLPPLPLRELVPKQAYRDFLDEPLRGDFFSAAGRRQPKMA